jgi:outer membrane protein assembly factor BamB
MNEALLTFDMDKSALICKDPESKKILWVKKINEAKYIEDIIEDNDSFYVSSRINDKLGTYLAIDKAMGSTRWYIPGCAYFHVIYSGHLYLIFIDELERYFLIKADRKDGSKLWHRAVDHDLVEYSFSNNIIELKYGSGKIERLSLLSGR